MTPLSEFNKKFAPKTFEINLIISRYFALNFNKNLNEFSYSSL
jgi:hypothetical protein